jgi:hypothetical protein
MGNVFVRYGLRDNYHKRMERQAHGSGPDLTVSVQTIRDRYILMQGRTRTTVLCFPLSVTLFHRNCAASSIAVVLDSRFRPLSNEHVGSLLGFLTNFIHWSTVIDV